MEYVKVVNALLDLEKEEIDEIAKRGIDEFDFDGVYEEMTYDLVTNVFKIYILIDMIKDAIELNKTNLVEDELVDDLLQYLQLTLMETQRDFASLKDVMY